MEARQEMQHPYMNAVQNKQEEMQRLLETPSLMTESEKAMEYNKMMNDIIAYKKQLQSQVAQQPHINIPNNPNILQEVQPTSQLVRKWPSLLTPLATADPANLSLPSSSASEDEQSTKKKKNNVDNIE